MTTSEQYNTIAATAWPLAVRTKVANVLATMTDLDADVDEVRTTVDDIPVTVSWAENKMKISAGTADNGKPLWEWTVPKTWITEDPAP